MRSWRNLGDAFQKAILVFDFSKQLQLGKNINPREQIFLTHCEMRGNVFATSRQFISAADCRSRYCACFAAGLRINRGKARFIEVLCKCNSIISLLRNYRIAFSQMCPLRKETRIQMKKKIKRRP